MVSPPAVPSLTDGTLLLPCPVIPPDLAHLRFYPQRWHLSLVVVASTRLDWTKNLSNTVE